MVAASDSYSSPGECGFCGEATDHRNALELEWPSEDAVDPGYVALRLCDSCASTVATIVLSGRASVRDCGVYEGLDLDENPPRASEGGDDGV